MIILEATGHCPNLSAPGRSHRRDANVRLSAAVGDLRIDDFEDMFENAPCGYITLQANGRIERVNRTLLGWTGHTADQMVGKRFSDFLNMAGRIYYETHIAPLLRMQGFFNEFAIDMVTADGEPVQMIANALEGRDAAGKPMFIRLALIKATDRRRYEHELLEARDVAKNELGQRARNCRNCASSSLRCSATIFAILSPR